MLKKQRLFTGAPPSPRRTWAENDLFSIAFRWLNHNGRGFAPSYSAHVRLGERGAPVKSRWS
jgi:hypothetical protein